MSEIKDFPDRPWTIKELGEYLQLSERTIHARIKDSGLPFVRIGGMMRFIRADVDAWIARQSDDSGKADGSDDTARPEAA